jgi:hypothetical protein
VDIPCPGTAACVNYVDVEFTETTITAVVGILWCNDANRTLDTLRFTLDITTPNNGTDFTLNYASGGEGGYCGDYTGSTLQVMRPV